MTKPEIYMMLRHGLEAHAQLLGVLERQDVIDALTAKAPQQTPEIVPHASEEFLNLSALLRKASDDQRKWLLDSGIDSFPRFMAFLDGLTTENIETIKAVAKREGYG